MLKVKQRKLDRLSDENDSLLGQVDTYCAQLKDATNSDVRTKAELQKVQGELDKAVRESKVEKKKNSIRGLRLKLKLCKNNCGLSCDLVVEISS